MSGRVNSEKENNKQQKENDGRLISRRDFLKISSLAIGTVVLPLVPFRLLEAQEDIGNPLEHYPYRNWEETYRDQYRYDNAFTFVCSPNDTHQCRVKAYVRNGIAVRTEQTYEYGNVRDKYGNFAIAAYNPRMCLKGMTIMRRVYGPQRVKYPMVRKTVYEAYKSGKLQWNQDNRGTDEWVKVSWDEALDLVARKVLDVADNHGPETIKLSPTIKFAGAMSKQGSMNRFANMLGLFGRKASIGKTKGQVTGATTWSEYDWYGDLDPGHPPATGIQTFDPELPEQRDAKLLVHVGKNMVENKMAASHWVIEAMERGAKIVGITPDYNGFSTKCDYWIPVRPGSDVALFLGVANYIIQNKLYDADFLTKFTDSPLLIRMDTLKRLKANDVIEGKKNEPLKNMLQQIDPKLREEWGDFIVWDKNTNSVKPITREELGETFAKKGVNAALEGEFTVKLLNGEEVLVKPHFQLMKEAYSEYDSDTVSQITSAPKNLIEQLAVDLATIKPASIHSGEGVNHYYHNDIKGRAFFLVQSLTGNIGKPGGNVGTWAGNYKLSLFDGIPTFYIEDPQNPVLDENVSGKDIPKKKYSRDENPVYFAYGGNTEGRHTKFTGETHKTPVTKIRWHSNQNFVNNAKWAYQIVNHWDKDVELIVNNEWEWTMTCEYADVVFPVHSWMEVTIPELEGSCSEPFMDVWTGGLKPIFDTKMDVEVMAGVARKMADILINDVSFAREVFKELSMERKREIGQKMIDYWHFVDAENPEKFLVYIQRVLDAGSTTNGYNAKELLDSDKSWFIMTRTTPRIPGWEQVHEDLPFYTRTGRLENYKEEDEFIKEGENMIVHREPIESTPYLPNVIVNTHEAIRPEKRNIPLDATDVESKQARNVKMPWSRVKESVNPQWAEGYRLVLSTPKSRHRVHSSWGACDWNVIWQSNFGDPYRMDKRSPHVGEMEANIHPEDAKAAGINDGDYIYVDADPTDRPFVGWQNADSLTKEVARLMIRCKFNPRMRPGMITIKHGPWGASHKSVTAQRTREDGLSLTKEGYIATCRFGSQQSCTRLFLKPTQMTDSLARKNAIGHTISTGYESPVHSPSTCPKEALVRITKAEDGGIGGKGAWEPAESGFTPDNEKVAMRRYMAGGFIEVD